MNNVRKLDYRQPRPEKSSNRVSINAFMMGNLFFIFTLIWTISPEKFSPYILAQLVLAIPLFLISSLSYSKVGYWEKHEAWDRFGWITNTVGNIFILNVIGLMTASFFRNLALVYFALIILLFGIYYAINVKYKPHTKNERIIKFILFLIILFFGGILPSL
jgi:hypothetical protein